MFRTQSEDWITHGLTYLMIVRREVDKKLLFGQKSLEIRQDWLTLPIYSDHG